MNGVLLAVDGSRFIRKGMVLQVGHGEWPHWMEWLRLPMAIRLFLQRWISHNGQMFGPTLVRVTKIQSKNQIQIKNL